MSKEIVTKTTARLRGMANPYAAVRKVLTDLAVEKHGKQLTEQELNKFLSLQKEVTDGLKAKKPIRSIQDLKDRAKEFKD
jgi:hypothetical protein